MNFYRRWDLVAEGYRGARGKKHGAGSETRYKSIVLGLMMRAIALRYRRFGWALFLAWGWRFYLAGWRIPKSRNFAN